MATATAAPSTSLGGSMSSAAKLSSALSANGTSVQKRSSPATPAGGGAAAAGSPSPPRPRRRHKWRNRLLKVLDKANIIVTAAVAVTILRARSTHSLYTGAGGVAAMLTAKGLKKCLKQERPEGARAHGTTYGMPSTHSTSMGYWGTYCALALPSALSSPILGTLAAIGSVSASVAICWSRIALGHHSKKQVVAGVSLGALIAVLVRVAWLGTDAVPLLSRAGPSLAALASFLPHTFGAIVESLKLGISTVVGVPLDARIRAAEPLVLDAWRHAGVVAASRQVFLAAAEAVTVLIDVPHTVAASRRDL